MAVLGPNYPISQVDSQIPLYSNPISARPPAYPYYDGLTLRDASSRQKIRLELLSNVGNLVAKTGYGVWVKKVGSPTGTFWVEWGYSADSTTPPVSFTASGTPVNCSALSDSEYTFVYFSDMSIPVADPSKQYIWVVLNGDFSVGASNYLVIAAQAVDAGDSFHQWNGSAWSNSGSGYALNGVSYPRVAAEYIVGQAFYVDESRRPSSIKLKLQRTGTLTGSAWLEIVPVKNFLAPVTFWEPEYTYSHYDTVLETYVSGPNREILAVSDRITLASIPTSAVEVEFEFSAGSELQFGEHYAFILRTDDTFTVSNYLSVGADITSPVYTEGAVLFQLKSDHVAGGGYRMGFSVLGFEIYFVERELLAERLTAIGDPPGACGDLRSYLTEVIQTLKDYFPAVVPEPYGGTGESSYSKGDILYAVETDNLKRLPIGSTSGMTLTVSEDGLPEWAKNGGQVLEKLTNKSGVQLDPGDVVIWSTSSSPTPGSITYTSTPHTHDQLFCGVVVEPTLADGRGFVCTQGVTQVRLSGTCSLGDYLGLAYTARRAVSQGTHPGPMRALAAGTDGQLIDAYIDTGRNDTSPTGSSVVWWTTTPPPGWLLAAGQAVSRSQYAKLFSIIGTTFGAGDGSTTFNLPDLRSRTVIGLDNMGAGNGAAGRVMYAITDSIGQAGGEELHTLTIPEIPTHDHPFYIENETSNSAATTATMLGQGANAAMYRLDNGGYVQLSANTLGDVGGGGAHNNMQPSIRGTWIIKVV